MMTIDQSGNYEDEVNSWLGAAGTDIVSQYAKTLLVLALEAQVEERRGRWRDTNRENNEIIRAGRLLFNHILNTDKEILLERSFNGQIRFNDMLRALVINGTNIFPCTPND